MIQVINKNIQLILSAFVLTMGIASSLSMGSLSAQAATNYSCPAGTVQSGATCVAANKIAPILCNDLSAPDSNGNCGIKQNILFTCDGRPNQIVLVEAGAAESNRTYDTTLCTTRTGLFVRSTTNGEVKCPSGYTKMGSDLQLVSRPEGLKNACMTFTGQRPTIYTYVDATYSGCIRTDYMNNPVDGRWIDEYTKLANENNQTRETQYCYGGARICPVNTRLAYYPSATFSRLLGNSAILCVAENFNFRANGLLPIAFTSNGGNSAAECDASYDVISKWDWSGGDAEVNQICAKKSYKAVAQTSGAASLCPTGWTDAGSDKCSIAATPTSATISNENVGAGTCNPNPTTQGQNVVCTFPLTGSANGVYILPPEGVYAVVRNVNGDMNSGLGNSNLCTVSGSVMTCTNVPVPANTIIGTREVVGHRPGIEWMPNKAQLTVNAKQVNTTNNPLTITDLTNGSIKITCNEGKEVVINSTTTCSFDIGNKTLPDNTKIAIGNGDISTSNCTLNGTKVTCTNVSTGSQTGNQPIMAKIGTGDKADTNQKVNVVEPKTTTTTTTVVAEDFKNPTTNNNNSTIKITCNDSKEVVINSTTTCTFDIGNKTLPDNTKIAIGNGDINTSNCKATGSKVTCTNVSTGSESGDQPLYIKIGNGDKVNTNQKVKVSGDTSPAATLVRSGAGTAIAGTVGTLAMSLAGFFYFKSKNSRNAKMSI
jgi:hypothetical protein